MPTDLFSVAASLRSEGALRRFATDGSVPVEARTGLVTELFSGKVDAVTLDLLGSAVARRWIRTRDLADAMEELGVVAAVRSAGGDSGRLVDELFAVRSLIGDNSDLRNALSDPARSVEDKEALLDELLAGKALPGHRACWPGSPVQQLTARSPRCAGGLRAARPPASTASVFATVTLARPWPRPSSSRLADALSRQYWTPVHLNVVVDRRVIGGIRVEIGDDVIDGTVSSRLDDARRKLAG